MASVDHYLQRLEMTLEMTWRQWAFQYLIERVALTPQKWNEMPCRVEPRLGDEKLDIVEIKKSDVTSRYSRITFTMVF